MKDLKTIEGINDKVKKIEESEKAKWQQIKAQMSGS